MLAVVRLLADHSGSRERLHGFDKTAFDAWPCIDQRLTTAHLMLRQPVSTFSHVSLQQHSPRHGRIDTDHLAGSLMPSSRSDIMSRGRLYTLRKLPPSTSLLFSFNDRLESNVGDTS